MYATIIFKGETLTVTGTYQRSEEETNSASEFDIAQIHYEGDRISNLMFLATCDKKKKYESKDLNVIFEAVSDAEEWRDTYGYEVKKLLQLVTGLDEIEELVCDHMEEILS